MGKSSSSSKKIKRSKDSSKLRSVNKKKSKRTKSKKIRRIKDYSDESESSGSDSSLYSTSSEDDYRRKKRRSKLTKKRSRKRYSSSESDDDDDDTRLLKKKKRSKRKYEHVGTKKKKKKIGSRKRRKRDTSSSSDSSSVRDSQSDDGSESDGKRRTRDRGRVGKVRRSKDGSEEDSEPDECWQVEEDEVMTEKNSRRLKSIVVVSYSYDKDEDMVDDHDDVYLRHGGNSDREFGRNEESDSDNGRKTVDYDEFEEDNTSETSKDNSLKDEDLEAILKQRALENLKRFRGEAQKSGIARKDVSSVAEGEPKQIESERTEELQDHELMDCMEKKKMLRGSTGSREFEISQKILHEVDYNVSESGTVFPDIASQQSGDTVKGKLSSGISSCSSKRKLIRPVLGQESSLNLATGKEAAGCEDAEVESINGDTIDRNCPESSLALATKNGGENIEPTKVSSTLNAQSSSHADIEALDEIRGESQSQSQPEQKTSGETKEESQYEQKTMTVMRGGEMVQVSYKVYIPKKTSSLGRRKLKR